MADTRERPLPEHVTTPLLTLITSRSLDEDYAHVARRKAEQRASSVAEGHAGEVGPGAAPAGVTAEAGEPASRASRPHWATLLAVGALGVMAAVVAVQTDREEAVNELSRAALIEQIDGRRAQLRGLQSQVADLTQGNQDAIASTTRLDGQLSDLESRVRRAELITGFTAVHGPGLEITVDNPEGVDPNSEIRDEDLAILVDGLWQAGAEAIAINDQRINALGGIRNANRAVHVNGRPVNAPYVVSVIGDDKTLAARLVQTSEGQEWFALVNGLGFVYTSQNVDDISLPAAPDRQLRDVIEVNADPDGIPEGEGSAP